MNNNPFNSLNPYPLKAKFYSETKSSNKKANSSNPQSLLYKRNYKQNPATFQGRQVSLKKKFASVKQKNINHQNQYGDINDQLYKLHYKQFFVANYCPSDSYLQSIKDKITFSQGNNSQFQRTVKNSNICISKFASQKTPRNQYLSKIKENPFLRKNLISYPGQMPQGTYFPDYNIGQAQSINFVTHYDYDLQNFNESKQYQDQNQESNPVYNLLLNRMPTFASDRQPSPRQSPERLQCSFGHKNGRQHRKQLKKFIDTVIQTSLQDPLKVQQNAMKQIKIKGKVFYLNALKRLN